MGVSVEELYRPIVAPRKRVVLVLKTLNVN